MGFISFEEFGIFVCNFIFYLGFGLGVVFINEEIFIIGFNLKFEEDFGLLIIVFIDFGICFVVMFFFFVILKVGICVIFFDFLDGVSENGNVDVNDWYLIGGLGL